MKDNDCKYMNKTLMYEKCTAEEVDITVWQAKHSVMILLKSTKNTNTLSLAKWIKCISSAVPRNWVENTRSFIHEWKISISTIRSASTRIISLYDWRNFGIKIFFINYESVQCLLLNDVIWCYFHDQWKRSIQSCIFD